MNRSRFLLGAIVLGWALAALLGGCRRGERESADQRTSPEAVPLRVALMTPGPISDDGWNASAYEGLMKIREELGAEVAHKESRNEGQFKQDFRDFARRGYQLIIAHGFEYTNAARDVAEEFPETFFVTTGGLPENVRPNYAILQFVIDDGLYLCGVLAGKLTRTNRLGMIGGQEIQPVVVSFSAFQEGARSVNPDVRFSIAYVGNWEDAAKAREQALAQIREGVDLIVQNADKAGLGVFQAAKEAQAQGKQVYVFGTNRDQNHIEPSVVIASAVLKIPEAFVEMARRVRDGQFQGRLERLTLKDGWVEVVYNPQLVDRIPPEAQAAVESAREAILSGAEGPEE
ncbi:MAG: BMP family ABC transporter substrate-binding protein [Candidatus Poribacteria bacterium]|nr:MAG: BMP family ABC transporter substrate-binding protein [Candidatus Poribacteria bacterium]